MKFSIDTEKNELVFQENNEEKRVHLFSKEAFEIISRIWLKVGWNQNYSYTFSWMGRPIIQLPEDMVRVQEVIYGVKPDLIIETGVAHGGSLIYYASLCKAMGKGRVIGVDIEIRPHNRKAIEAHELSPLIQLFEGSSVDSGILEQVSAQIRPDETVMVILDSNHSRKHVLSELKAYAPFVSKGSYIIATDGVMRDLHDVPNGNHQWASDNPVEAVAEFLRENAEFVKEQPEWNFNESELSENITYWPDAYLKRIL